MNHKNSIKKMQSKKSLSIAALLFMLNGIILCAAFFILLNQVTSALKNTAELQTEKNLHTFSNIIVPQAISHCDDIDNFLKDSASQITELRLTVVDENGKVIADSDVIDPSTLENHLGRKEIAQALSGNEGKAIRKSTVTDSDVMYFAVPIQLYGKNYAFRLSMPVEKTVYFTTDVRLKMTASICMIFAVLLIFSFSISAYIVHKIRLLTKTSEEYKNGNFKYKCNVNSPREFAQLGTSMENMAAELEKLEQVRKDFVSNVSHELKTPVTSIIGFTETLLDGAIDDKKTARHFLEIINSQSNRLMSIIEDLLTLSRLEKDKKKPESMKCDIVELSKKIMESFTEKANAKNTKLNFSTAEISSKSEINSNSTNYPRIFCMVNKGLYQEAIGNLIDNAIKYCPEKSEITCKVKIKEHSAKTVQIIIQDNGKGIPIEFRERIFERFYRIDKGRSRDTGGTGLGLSIASHIIKAHDGILYVTDRPDKISGASFVAEIPVIS